MTITEQDAQDRADMQQLVAGHDASLNDLMDRHAQPVFRFLYRMLGNEEDARDLAQETFVRVYRSKDRYEPDRSFSKWLYTIAGNLGRNHLRWRARHASLSLDVQADGRPMEGEMVLTEPAANPAGQLQENERAAAVQAAVWRLPEDLREALVLCEWEEMTMAEAAEVLDTTPKAVESRLYRARKQLREAMKSWLAE